MTIPANALVAVNPSVLGPGGTGIDIAGLFLSSSIRVPAGTVGEFSNGAAVADYFGSGSAEDLAANGGTNRGGGYFAGFTGSTRKPGRMLIAQYNANAVAAYLRGGDVSGLTLTQLQAITGSLNVTFDGYARNAASVNLSSATSFSNAATIIQTALNTAETTLGTFTGVVSTTTLTVSGGVTGAAIAVGQQLKGAGVTAGTIITAFGTGTGGNGTYTINNSQTVGSETMTTTGADVAVSYDSVSGGFLIASGITGAPSLAAYATGTISASLKLTLATGAVTSQGAAAAVPATFMAAVVVQNANWATFTTLFDPDTTGQNTVKQAFAAWNTAQNNRFAYVPWDLDQSPTTALPASTSLGQILLANGNSGTMLLDGETVAGWDSNLGPATAAMVMGTAASIDFTETNGRTSFAFRRQDGLLATTVNPVAAANLGGNPQVADSFGNGYNFYGAYAQANQTFLWLQRGLVTGDFRWFDSYINQIWLNTALQNDILLYLRDAKSTPYTQTGYGALEAAIAPTLNQATAFGMMGPGTLSESQIAQVNAAAGGKNIASSLQALGYYLLIGTVPPNIRFQRVSPPMKLFYIDNGSVQAITLASIALT